MFRPLTLHVTNVLVRGAASRSNLVENLGAQPLRNVRMLRHLVDTVGQSTRGCVTAGDQEIDDLIGENLLVCGKRQKSREVAQAAEAVYPACG